MFNDDVHSARIPTKDRNDQQAELASFVAADTLGYHDTGKFIARERVVCRLKRKIFRLRKHTFTSSVARAFRLFLLLHKEFICRDTREDCRPRSSDASYAAECSQRR